MRSFKTHTRMMTIGALLVAIPVGLLPVIGCGEDEAPIVASDKSKDDLQKEIENPFGVEVKTGKAKSKSSRRN